MFFNNTVSQENLVFTHNTFQLTQEIGRHGYLSVFCAATWKMLLANASTVVPRTAAALWAATGRAN